MSFATTDFFGWRCCLQSVSSCAQVALPAGGNAPCRVLSNRRNAPRAFEEAVLENDQGGVEYRLVLAEQRDQLARRLAAHVKDACSGIRLKRCRAGVSTPDQARKFSSTKRMCCTSSARGSTKLHAYMATDPQVALMRQLDHQRDQLGLHRALRLDQRKTLLGVNPHRRMALRRVSTNTLVGPARVPRP